MTQDGDFLWWRDGVIYQIYPLSFRDSDGDGFGDLPGIISRLDYIADLGADAVWLSPVNVSPMKDFGYDVSDYEDIDPLFGTLGDFDNLIREAHSRNIRIIMDMVFNHTSDRHPWFEESRSSPDNPKSDWYIWHNPKAGGGPPNNWVSAFGGSAWAWEPRRRQYYYHMFLKEQPDLNWRNSEVRKEILRVMKLWLDRGVDGFRLDVANGYLKDAQFRNNPQGSILATPQEWRRNLDSNPKTLIPLKTAWQRQTHLYDRDLPEITEIHSAFRRLLDSYPERCAIGEIGGQRIAAQYTGRGKLHLAFLSALPAFTDYSWHPAIFQEIIREQESAFGLEGQPCYFLSNHDIPRHISRYAPLEMKFLTGQSNRDADDRAKVAAAMLLTLRGTPFLYYGEEIGMRQVFIPPWRLQDPVGKRYWPIIKGRDGCRTPMQWDKTKNAGFSTGRPWFPVGASWRRYNVADEKDDPNSILSFYRELIRLRKNNPALQRGTYRPLIANPENVMAYLRETPKQKILVMLNFFSRREQISLASGFAADSKWRIICSNTGRTGEIGLAVVDLVPYEVIIAEEI